MVQVMTDRFNAPVVYCHNDLLSGNLMLNDDEGNLSCIVLQWINSLSLSLHMGVCRISFGVCFRLFNLLIVIFWILQKCTVDVGAVLWCEQIQEWFHSIWSIYTCQGIGLVYLCHNVILVPNIFGIRLINGNWDIEVEKKNEIERSISLM